ncbi:MAG: GTPase obg [Candidatus Beckwithbacteria bacterium GW2011_GWC2_47_9]|uniref:GTPase Obg n=3 Tax=Microgenomates group TaxID=1794810 RepID=A0A1F5HUI2_9BACT|nr:MAG: GTPase obg [Candidatus Beckwithbacteria bacterium GW2011_GWC2_47_9]OGE07625.1 MAG: GTPase ObgE [Candidatus Curtissbacteria bacterium RIFCSPLOWO2_02_41_11]
MIDYARITARAGDGGVGNGSFFRIKGKRYGKANGGDGGRGGDVYLLATRDLNTLESFRYVKDYQAKNGTNGLSRRRRGADGRDLVIRVPVGTLVRGTTGSMGTTSTKGSESSKARDTRDTFDTRDTLLFDLIEQDQKVLIARGGDGGRGNAHLRDQFGRRPKIGEQGQVGEVCHLTLELKLIADVGLIGLPNSGKSTLLSVLTAARPKIAPYPFTTLEPNLGVLTEFSVQGLGSSNNLDASSLATSLSLVIADIPGLIEGASRGRGLGDLFLRHIERTKILLHLIDISGKSDKWQDYQVIRNELKAYSKELAKKKELIVLNKIDLIDLHTVDKYVGFFRAKKKKTFAISALKKENLTELVSQINKMLLIAK